MTGQREFLALLVDRLQAANIPFMVSGSLASSFHGRPRATNDVDLVVDPSPEALASFLRSLPPDWYVSEPAATDALRRRSMFNIVDPESGWKADLVIRKDREFSSTELRRRMLAEVLGEAVPVATPEDVILTKLEWSKESGSDRQYEDAVGVALLRWEELDRAYLATWATRLDVTAMLERLLHDVDDLRGSGNQVRP